MQVKQVLMIAVVLLAMFVVPTAVSAETTTVSYSSDATFTIIYPAEGVTLDAGSAIGEAGIQMIKTDPGSTVKLSISSGGDGFKLIHAYDPSMKIEYTIKKGETNLAEEDIIVNANAGTPAVQKESLSFSVNTAQIPSAGSYGDTLTFTAEYVIPYVRTHAEAQAAIDNAVPGTIIRLGPGDFGTLVFGQNTDSKVVDIGTHGGDAENNEHYSEYKDILIIGSPNAVVDQIDFKVGWISNSEGGSYVNITNLTVQGVTFSGDKTAFHIDGSKGGWLGINGLTIDNCNMTDSNGNDRFVFQQISGYKDLNDKTNSAYVMTTGVKNLKITGCEVTGAYMVIESRAMENLTITNNLFKGIKQRDMLITSDTTNHADKTYTGTITITDNTADSSEERFIRASLNDCDAAVEITGNIITNYKGADDDYIKVEGVGTGGSLTISGNSATPADPSRTLTTFPVLS